MAKILIVDDDFDDLESMKEILEEKKHKVKIATNGAQAMDLLQTDKFDLFLIDVKMPTLSGYDLARLIRSKKNGSAKIIFVSIVPKQEVAMDEVDGFIQKPFDPDNLIKAVKKILGGK